MAKGPFKMKGSPMQRNFGIGSPLRANGEEKRPDKVITASGKRQLYETPSGNKYYKEADGSKTYITPKGNSGDKRTVDPYAGEKKIYTTEGKPSKKKKKTTKKKTTVEKVKDYITTKKKEVKESVKDFLNI